MTLFLFAALTIFTALIALAFLPARARARRRRHERKILHWRKLLWDTAGNIFDSPSGATFDISATSFAASPNNTKVIYNQSVTPDVGGTVVIQAAADYDTVANPLKIGSVAAGFIFFVENNQVTPVKVLSPISGDTGVIVDPSSTSCIGVSIRGLSLLGGGGGGGTAVSCTVYAPLGGGLDDGPNLQNLLQLGNVCLVAGALYTIATSIDVTQATNHTLHGDGATLKGNMAPTGGTASSIFKSVPTIAGSGNTTLNGNAVIGANTLVVTAVGGALAQNGVFIRVSSGANAALQTIYQVIQITGTTLTLDRPILEPFLNTDIVQVIVLQPLGVNIIGPLTITGSGDRAIDFQGMRRGYVSQVKVDVSQRGLANATLSGGIIFDISSVECVAERCEVTGRDVVGNADVFDFSLAMFGAELCTFAGCQGRHATTTGVFLKDAFRCTLKNTDATDCTTAAATGVAVSATAAATGSTSTDCLIDGGSIVNCVNGLGVSTALRLHTRNLQIINCSTLGMTIGPAATVPTDCSFDGCSILGGAGGVTITATAVRPMFSDLTIASTTSTLFDCSSAVLTIKGFRVPAMTTTPTAIVVLRVGTLDAKISDCEFVDAAGSSAISNFFFSSIGATGRIFLDNVRMTANTAGDTGINHSGAASTVVMSNMQFLNPGAVGATIGYVGGATVNMKRFGRVDFQAAATPFSTGQFDQGTLVANGGAAVDVAYTDIDTTAIVLMNEKTAGGTAAAHTYTITKNTKFTFTGTAGDTSTYAFKIFD